MYAISQFYILSPRGDTIISRNYRDDVGPTNDVFFRNLKFWHGTDGSKGTSESTNEAPPCFCLDGVSYIYIKQNGLYFVFTTRFSMSPNFALELLCRLAKVFKDYCGVLSEEAIRKNFIMVYELLDEILDYGIPQCASTEQLKVHVHTEPVEVHFIKQNAFKLPSMSPKTTPSTSVCKPVTLTGRNGQYRNEIFVDIFERITMLFNNEGYVLSSAIEGCIQLKSYLASNPQLRLALNPGLVVGKPDQESTSHTLGVVLDDCNFHECVRLDDFDTERTLKFVPPDGEFVLMNYRITSEFMGPFRISPFIEQLSDTQVEVVIRLRAELPLATFASDVTATIPVPKRVNGVSCKFEKSVVSTEQTVEYLSKDHNVTWTIQKFMGGAEYSLHIKIELKDAMSPQIRREIGPVLLGFEVPMYSTSNLQVRYLRPADQNSTYNPQRWVRYVTQSSSYVCRI